VVGVRRNHSHLYPELVGGISQRLVLRVRLISLLVFVALTACGPAPAPPARTQGATGTEPWYGQTVDQLAAMNRQAKELLQAGKSDAAAAIIVKGEALSKRLISVPRPTLAATMAASDLDELYGQMLLSNRNYGWARLLFQKNLARWKYWKPPTAETARRLKEAEAAIAECDRRLGQ